MMKPFMEYIIYQLKKKFLNVLKLYILYYLSYVLLKARINLTVENK